MGKSMQRQKNVRMLDQASPVRTSHDQFILFNEEGAAYQLLYAAMGYTFTVAYGWR